MKETVNTFNTGTVTGNIFRIGMLFTQGRSLLLKENDVY
jgi:hypothetical protein